jgi:methyl-accepting chemotaxis protein
MFKISNITIGAKLAVMSALGILLVAAIIVIQMLASSSIGRLTDKANERLVKARDLQAIKASERGMRIEANNIRFAMTDADLQQAIKLLDVEHRAARTLVDPMIPKYVKPERRAQVVKIKNLIDRFAVEAKEVASMKSKAIAAGAKGAAEAKANAAALNADAFRVMRERLLPTIAEVERDIAKIDKIVSGDAQKGFVNVKQTMASSDHTNLAVGFTAIAILIGSAVFGAMSIGKPLRALVPPLEKVARGNFAIEVAGAERKDEVGQIARAVAQMAEKVSKTIAEIKASGREVTNASAEIATSTTDLSQRTEEQAASLEETSAAMEELSSTVKKNAENAQHANQSANSTMGVADHGSEVVAQAVNAMAKIEDSSRKIADIIGVIDEIARQTNLLALNAAVEAARAGEAGRGFAVVASEVRSLAQRSSQAAKDIKDLITNSNDHVKDGVELVNRAGASLNEIVESIKSVATIVAEIANASTEQATGIEQINRALTQMDQATQQNSALVEENAATAKTLEDQAKAMDERVAFFHIGEAGNTSGAVASVSKPSAVAPIMKAPTPAKQKPVPQLKQVAADRSDGNAVRKMQESVATAMNADADWQEF